MTRADAAARAWESASRKATPPDAHRSRRSPCCRPSVCSARCSLCSLWFCCCCCCDREEPQRTQRTQRPDIEGPAASSTQATRCRGLQSASRRMSSRPETAGRALAHPPIRLRSPASPRTAIHAPARRAFRGAESCRARSRPAFARWKTPATTGTFRKKETSITAGVARAARRLLARAVGTDRDRRASDVNLPADRAAAPRAAGRGRWRRARRGPSAAASRPGRRAAAP